MIRFFMLGVLVQTVTVSAGAEDLPAIERLGTIAVGIVRGITERAFCESFYCETKGMKE